MATVLIASPVAYADGPHIESLEIGDWGDTVRALQRDVGSEGRTLRLVVRQATGEYVPCDVYALEFDAIGRSAFEDYGCDRRGFTTTIRVAHRDALFAPAAPVPMPLSVAATVISLGIRFTEISPDAHSSRRRSPAPTQRARRRVGPSAQ